jgi:hydrogenase maturation protease
MSYTLVLAYGNTLRGDDGIGPAVGERLRALIQDSRVEIHTLHQLTPELMEPISRAGRVLFIDACEGPIPGAVTQRTIEPSTVPAGFTHHVTPESLLAGAKSLYGRAPVATILNITGADFSVSPSLSPAVASQLEAIVSMGHALACPE